MLSIQRAAAAGDADRGCWRHGRSRSDGRPWPGAVPWPSSVMAASGPGPGSGWPGVVGHSRPGFWGLLDKLAAHAVRRCCSAGPADWYGGRLGHHHGRGQGRLVGLCGSALLGCQSLRQLVRVSAIDRGRWAGATQADSGRVPVTFAAGPHVVAGVGALDLSRDLTLSGGHWSSPIPGLQPTPPQNNVGRVGRSRPGRQSATSIRPGGTSSRPSKKLMIRARLRVVPCAKSA